MSGALKFEPRLRQPKACVTNKASTSAFTKANRHMNVPNGLLAKDYSPTDGHKVASATLSKPIATRGKRRRRAVSSNMSIEWHMERVLQRTPAMVHRFSCRPATPLKHVRWLFFHRTYPVSHLTNICRDRQQIAYVTLSENKEHGRFEETCLLHTEICGAYT